MTGASVRRREDPRLLTGRGRYVSDIRLPGMLEAAILRSPFAHARIARVDLEAARAAPGVVAALAYEDVADWARPIPQLVPYPGLHSRTSPILADGVVRYVGEPVVVVVAESRYQAEDGRDLAVVDYEPLEAAVDVEDAARADAPRVHEDLADNVAVTFCNTVGDAEAALRSAEVVVRERLRIGRISGQPMEGRGVVAAFEPGPAGGNLTVWAGTQSPHTTRRLLADQLGLPQHAVRVIAPDVGGGFGVKNRYYPEDTLVPFLARHTGRPVRWIEDRGESFVASYHEREQVHDATLGLNADGTIVCLVDRFLHDQGAYIPFGVVVPWVTSVSMVGPYRVPNVRSECSVVFTDKTPVAPYRGAGKPQGVFVMERLLDRAAEALAMDPAELRRRNLLRQDEMPYDTGLIDRDGSRVEYDSGDYVELQGMALEAIGYAGFRREQAEARERGELLGIGTAGYVEVSGRGPFEGATVRVEPSGDVVVLTGVSSQGQGHETTLADVCARTLGVDSRRVTVLEGDTGLIPLGGGTYASRVAVMAGSAVMLAAGAVREKALEQAARELESSPGDLEVEDGQVFVRGLRGRAVSLGTLARTLNTLTGSPNIPPALEPGLEATRYFRSAIPTYSGGVYAVVVSVEAATGAVRVVRHALAHDCGTVLSPALVEGQAHGAVAQGIGGALYEELVYDEAGQLQSGSYMDYLMPSADCLPPLLSRHMESPSFRNPLGAKGAGESGTLPVAPAINAAVEDALRQAGVEARLNRTPLHPGDIQRLLVGRSEPDRG